MKLQTQTQFQPNPNGHYTSATELLQKLFSNYVAVLFFFWIKDSLIYSENSMYTNVSI